MKAMESGMSVALLDLSGHGENQPDPDKVMPYHQLSRTLLWTGRTLLGEWTKEILAVARFLNGMFPGQTLGVHGFKETALASLFASVFCPDIRKVVLEDAPVSYQFCGHTPFYGMALPLPGILTWGDISLAAALSEAELQWVNPRNAAGELAEVPAQEIETYKKIIKNQE